MTLNRFQVLKHKTTHEKTLADVWLYYMDNFIDDLDFVELGDRTQDDILEAIIVQVCRQMFGPEDRISDTLLIEIPEHSFVHGNWAIGGRLGYIIYFQDSQTGIIAVPKKRSESGEVNYARFTNPMKGKKAPANINLN